MEATVQNNFAVFLLGLGTMVGSSITSLFYFTL